MSYAKCCLILLLPLMTACLGPAAGLYPEEEERRTVTAYVISHGWHTGIAFEGAWLREKLPAHERLPASEQLMIGWGDNRYYPSDNFRVDLFLRAAFLPTGSVVHVVGIDKPVAAYFANSEIVRVRISRKGMDRMTGFIADYFQKGENGGIEFAAEGLYRNSAFFEANGRYFFPKTSNRWTARVLRQSGFPITPFFAFTSGNVISQSEKNGEMIRRR